MKNENPPISLFEFQTVWLKYLSAMDRIIMEKGYEGLTSENICKSTGLPEKAIETYFWNLQTLLKMHDDVIRAEQF